MVISYLKGCFQRRAVKRIEFAVVRCSLGHSLRGRFNYRFNTDDNVNGHDVSR